MAPKSLSFLTKRAAFCTVFAITSTFFLISARPAKQEINLVKAQENAIKAVIFDLGDVLFTTSSKAKASIMTPLFLKNPYLVFSIIGMNIKKEYFKMLSQIPAQSTQYMYNDNEKMPQIMVDWMTGSAPENIYTTITKHINNSSRSQTIKKLFHTITKLIFNPQVFAKSQAPIHEMIQLTQNLKKAGYKLFILSNWDAHSFVILKKEYPHIFKAFDGIYISGIEKTGKPDPLFYKKIFEQNNLDPKNCLFIDDEPHNISAGKALGMKTILHSNFTNTCDQLKNLDLLT